MDGLCDDPWSSRDGNSLTQELVASTGSNEPTLEMIAPPNLSVGETQCIEEPYHTVHESLLIDQNKASDNSVEIIESSSSSNAYKRSSDTPFKRLHLSPSQVHVEKSPRKLSQIGALRSWSREVSHDPTTRYEEISDVKETIVRVVRRTFIVVKDSSGKL
ncbi:hypothetical protein ACOME3_002446 [Neoechinorhynchus agilis]